ncbi:hypothetical protein EJ03DRAFT_347124 [Teratosphaeria nubilosa]|uniref:Uncharacterized protein n=1 Tax=Teratosphaeria nubilosa TaxID=161662 RepID=A0A6G1LPK7_9PEZI|nr:hypothetical protein EJ03DRAFT_347124 [Teratosphaeria nubilosa]
MLFRSALLAAIAVLAVNASPIADVTDDCTQTSVDGQACKYVKPDLTTGAGTCLAGTCTPNS